MIQLECNKITLSYNKKPVVTDLSFQVEKGDFLAIVGENGSGKSTLLRGILGLKAPDRGKLDFHGMNRQDIGYLPQQEGELEQFPATVAEIVRSGLLKSRPFGLFYTKEQKNKAQKLMEAMEISSIAQQSFQELSGGQRQRVLLARALAAAKEMLVLDEPTTGLDPLVTAGLYTAITRENRDKNITVIMVSHHVDKALSMATKILHLGNRDVFFGTPEAYRNSPIGQAFLQGV